MRWQKLFLMVLFRRLDLGSMGFQDEQAVRDIMTILNKVKNRKKEEKVEEIKEYLNYIKKRSSFTELTV